MEFKAKVYKIYDTEHVSEKFMKREFILLEAYPTRFGEVENFVKFQLTQQNVGQADGLRPGDEVVVKFNLDGRMWKKDENSEEVCFVNLSAYSVALADNVVAPGEAKKAEPASSPTNTPPPKSTPTAEGPTNINAAAGKDDLPF